MGITISACYFYALATLRGLMAWTKSIVEWMEDNTAFISVVFSWDLNLAYQRAVWYKSLGYNVRVGGPAVHGTTMFDGIAEIGGHIPDVVSKHNPEATFTTRGCPNKCAFCLVPKIEPEYVELDDFPIRPIICDNNILASTDYHFDMVMEKLSDLENIDFNQGLDSRLLTINKATKLAKLKTDFIRLAFDSRSYEKQFLRGFYNAIESGIPKSKIRVYVLINFRESPEDALYRLEKVRELGALPCPMRYQPVNAMTKNSYIANGWNERLIRNMTRYYFRLSWLGGISFDEYNMSYGKVVENEEQMELWA